MNYLTCDENPQRDRSTSEISHVSGGPRGARRSLSPLLGPHIGQLCLAQVEFPLDSAPRLIFQLAASIQLVDLLPFGFDQREFNLVM